VIVPPSRSMSLRIESAVTDLPDPDSPTSATVRPGAMPKLKSRTASTK
jgi:hypothetical protein